MQTQMHGPQFLISDTYVAATTGTTAHVKTAWQQATASLPVTVSGFIMRTFPLGSGTANFLFDVGIGAAGSEKIILNNYPHNRYNGARGLTQSIFVPVKIPAGTRVAVRAQNSEASAQPWDCTIEWVPYSPYLPSYSRCDVYGAIEANTAATDIDPGATANAKGAWAQLTASSSYDARAIAVAFSSSRNSVRSICHWFVDIGIGAAGSEVVLLPDLFVGSHTTSDAVLGSSMTLPINVPAGTRFAARAQCGINDATDRLMRTTLYLFS